MSGCEELPTQYTHFQAGQRHLDGAHAKGRRDVVHADGEAAVPQEARAELGQAGHARRGLANGVSRRGGGGGRLANGVSHGGGGGGQISKMG